MEQPEKFTANQEFNEIYNRWIHARDKADALAQQFAAVSNGLALGSAAEAHPSVNELYTELKGARDMELEALDELREKYSAKA